MRAAASIRHAMTDIPEYGQFIQAQARENESAADIVADAARTLALQLREEAQSLSSQPDEDRAAQIDRVEEALRLVGAEFADPRGHAVRRLELCELLRLPRICALARCRKSAGCRGGGRCLHQVKVPQPVFAGACALMLAARLPWITSGRANERVAYEAWVAAMEAGSPSARPRESGDPVLGSGFPLARE
jgi:hypothetical protein